MAPSLRSSIDRSCLYSISAVDLARISGTIADSIAAVPYTLPEGSTTSIKSLLLDSIISPSLSSSDDLSRPIKSLLLALVFLAASDGEDSPTLYWIPLDLARSAASALGEVNRAVGFREERELVEEIVTETVRELKDEIKQSFVDTAVDDVAACASSKPVAYSIVAAHQVRWLVTQVGYPHLGKLCGLVIPCALTALDHWSPEVKEQGMRSFIHLGKNLNATELGWYEEPILDACRRNIASSDELWRSVVEMSVLMLTCTQRRNPRSSWFDMILSEMSSHLDRQLSNKERRIAWLELIEPVFDAMGLVLLAHFRHIFSLFFYWMHADDDKTVVLVLERLRTIIKLTWIRQSPYFQRLVDELAGLYKETATRKNREVVRGQIVETLLLLQKCKGQWFEAAWYKHTDDPDLMVLASSLSG